MNTDQLGLWADTADWPTSAAPAKAVRKTRARKTVAAPALPEALVQVAAAPTGPRALQRQSEHVPPTPAALTSPAPVDPPGAESTMEGLAQRLEQHPDYRVLRRLVPTTCFAGDAQGPVVTLLVLDTETTGLDASKDKVIELALLRVAVDTSTGLPVGPVTVYDGLEDPGRPLPPAITDITGITDAMVRGHRLDEDRINDMLNGVDLVVAHNAGFDRPFVEGRLPQFGTVAWACSFADLDWREHGQSSAKLENLALACGWFYDAHRAETDCHALLAVLARPLAAWSGASSAAPDRAGGDVGDGSGAAPPTGLAVLWRASGELQHRLQATGAPFEAKDALKARGYRWDAPQRVWGTTLRSEAALTQELAWLAHTVYTGRPTRVRVETLDARTRYSTRSGAPTMRLVGGGDLIE